MKKFIVTMMIAGLIGGSVHTAFAGDKDWARAGKALTIIEGLRVISRGGFDPIGTVTGIGRDRDYAHRHRHEPVRHYECREEREWVPSYRWEKRYVHEHEDYDPEHGQIWVEGHYIRYQVEDGGYWNVKETCR